MKSGEKWLLHAAMEGNPSAMQILGSEYAGGTRLRQNVDAAVRWLWRAADWSGAAGIMLADMYLDGRLVAKSFKDAIRCFDHTIKGRSRRNEAMKLLAKKGLDGRFSAAEEAVARSWLIEAAARAFASVADEDAVTACGLLALDVAELYDLGLGIERDQEKAVHWYKKCANLCRAQRRLLELGIDVDLLDDTE